MKTRNQSIGLLLILGLLSAVHSASAQTWTQTSAPSKTWSRIAASADGSKLIAVASGWNCYVSTNSGITWTAMNEPQNNSLIGSWYYMASSADGTKLLGSTASNMIYVSTNSGISWLSNNVPTATYWGPVAMSADGNELVAAAGGNGHPPGFIYVSTNWGVTWNATSAPTNVWTGLASSADGTKLVAVAGGSAAYRGFIYTSTNSGTTWLQTSAPSNYWESVGSSSDGTKLVAVYYKEPNNAPGHLFTSADSGNTWVSNSVAVDYWETVAFSADGETIIAGSQSYNNADLYVSTNFGINGVLINLASDFTGYLVGLASSADGGKLFAVSLGGKIYTSQITPSPQLNLKSLSTNLTLAWTIPSTNFLLQQSSDLTSWADVTNPPVLNFTNLQNQVTLSPSNSSGFYRLKTP